MSFPYANLDPDWWPEVNWHSLHGLPSANNNWPPNPDEVDFLVQPDTRIPSYYQFAATPQGLRFGCERLLGSSAVVAADATAGARDSSRTVNKVDRFDAAVTRGTDEWQVFFRIPWQTLGGKHRKSNFGFLPMRTRWREGEFSSPVALDLNEAMPVDLLIEISFFRRCPNAGLSKQSVPVAFRHTSLAKASSVDLSRFRHVPTNLADGVVINYANRYE